MSQGLRNKEIASRLVSCTKPGQSISERAVKLYGYRIFQKLGVDNRISAVLKFREILLSEAGRDRGFVGGIKCEAAD